ncbi:MAG: TrkA family potassium uptake protein [Pirellulales bacterium]
MDWRQPRLTLRYVQYVLWEFRWSIGIFWMLVGVGGIFLQLTYHYKEKVLTYPEACYAIFLMVFFEPNLDFPEEWYLQIAFFLVPVIGLGTVADSLVRLGFLLFTKKRHLQEWQRMAASIHRNHIIVVGVGKVGFRVITGLLELQIPVVAVERKNDGPFMDDVLDLEIPVIQGDARTKKILEQAGVAHARAIILATSDDLANLDAALTARDINPKVQVVLRLFDDTLAVKFAGAFLMPAISTSQVAAPAFIAAATGRKVYQQFQLAGETVHLVEITIVAGGALVGRSVGDLQDDCKVNIVMHHGTQGVNVNPGHELVLAAGDVLLAIAPIAQLLQLEAANVAPH